MKPWHFALTWPIALSVLFVAVACSQAPATPPAPAATAATAPVAGAVTPAPVAKAAQPVQELKAGIGTALSGASAALGIVYGRTYEMVAADIGVFEVAGKQYRWKLLLEDNLYTSAGGVASANKFINQEAVKFMYQLGSAAGAAVQPIAEGAKVIYDVASSDPKILGPKFKYTFRTYQTPVDTYPGFIGYLVKNQPQLKNWYILVSDDASGIAIDQTSKPILAYYGLNLLGATQYPRETTDFYPVLAKVLPTKPDVIITLAATAVGTLVKQAREQGYTGKFLATGVPSQLDKVAGVKNAEGFMVPDADMWSDKTPKALVDFANKYKAKYNEEWPGLARSTWPTLYLVTSAMKKAGTVADTDKIVQTMETEKLDTPLGPMFYGEASVYGAPHQLVWPLWVSEFQDGKVRTLATIPSDEAVKAVEAVFKK